MSTDADERQAGNVSEEPPGAAGDEAAGDAPAGGRRRFRRQAMERRLSRRQFGDPLTTVIGRREAVPDLSGGWLRLKARARNGRGGQRRPVPVVYQTEASDCGPASLAMVLNYHRVPVNLAELREQMAISRNGVSARTLLDVARSHGLSARGVRVGVPGLRNLRPGSILFWNFDHFVVFERATGRHVYIVDPAFGRRRMTADAVSDAFTGVALEFGPPLGGVRAEQPRGRFRRHPAAGRSPWRYLGYFLSREQPWKRLTGFSVLLMLFSLCTPLMTAYVVANAPSASHGQGARTLTLALGVLGAAGAYALLQILRGLNLVSLQAIADRQVTLGILEHLLGLPYDYFTRRNPGDLAMRVRTSTAVRQVLTTSALSALVDGLMVLVYLCLMLVGDTGFALVTLVLAAAQVLVLLVFWNNQRYLAAEALERQATAEGDLMEILDGMQTLKASGLESAAGERWSHSLIDEINARSRSRRSQAVALALGVTVQFVAPLAILVYGYLRVSRGDISLGVAVGYASLSVGLFAPLANLVQNALQVSGLAATLARLTDIVEHSPEQAGRGATVDLRGRVELSGVTFSHPGSAVPAVDSVSMCVEPGSFVAILGRSGSGKSTLASLIAGLQTPAAGSVSYGGVSLAEADRVDMRRRLSYVDQESRVFAGSIWDNIAYGMPDAPHERVVQAARLARIDEEIRAMPVGYSTLLGPGGLGVSGGQRQRIALARALLREPDMLILDEATSALDAPTEAEIFGELLGRDMTLIVVAHRLAVLESADKIVILTEGRVTGEGGFHDLGLASGAWQPA